MKNNLELKPIIKRVCAYLIDILLIMIFATIISNIKFTTIHRSCRKIDDFRRNVYVQRSS